MKKLIAYTMLCSLVSMELIYNAVSAENIQKITPAAPKIPALISPYIQKYNQGDYLYALHGLLVSRGKKGEENKKEEEYNYNKRKDKLKNEEDIELASYYIALCYHRLGMKAEASSEYSSLANSGKNETLRFLAKKGAACLEKPESQECTNNYVDVPLTDYETKIYNDYKGRLEEYNKIMAEKKEKADNSDITQFIKSKNMIHPAAMDKIMLERLERNLQAIEYAKNNQQNQQQ